MPNLRILVPLFLVTTLIATGSSAQNSGVSLRASHPESAVSGSEFIVDLTVVNSNDGPVTAPQLTIYASREIFTSVASDSWECHLNAPGEVVCTRAELPPSQTTIQLRLVASTHSPTTRVRAFFRPGDSGDQTYGEWQVVTTPAEPLADLGLTLAAPRDPVPLLEPYQIVATAGNSGPDTAPGVWISGHWSVPVTTTSPGWSCLQLARGFTCRSGALAPGESRDLVLDFPPGTSYGQPTLQAYLGGVGLFDPVSENREQYLTIGIGVAAEFERVLFPIALRPVDGALGSRWVTEHSLYLEGSESVEVFPFQYECQICTCFVPPTETLSSSRVPHPWLPLGNDPAQPGMFFYYQKKPDHHIHFQLRSRDVSRSAENWGTELPVVGDQEFRSGRILLMDIPTGDEFRQLVRVYGLDTENPATVTLNFHSMTNPDGPVTTRQLQLQVPEWNTGYFSLPLAPAYAQLSLNDLPELHGTDRIWIELTSASGERIWAFASITSNATQLVTTVTPQRTP